MSDLQPLLLQMIERWRSSDVALPKGVDRAEIAEFETRYGVRLPDDMREYFLTVDGMGNRAEMDDGMFGFWSLEEVKPVEEYCPHVVQRHPNSAGYYVFCDYSIEIFVYAIRLNRDDKLATPIARIYPYLEDDCSFDHCYDSFTEFIAEYANNPDELL